MTVVAENLCECGCGEPTKLAPTTSPRLGWVRGEPMRFIHGHRARLMESKRSWTVDESSGCWVWDGKPTAAGYGRTTVDGQEVYAHRWSWTEHRGPIPPGHHVHHECGNRRCVNPDHLAVLSEAEHKGLHLAERNRR